MQLPAKLVLMVLCVATATITEAQVTPSVRRSGTAAAKPSAVIPPQPAAPVPAAPLSLLDQPPAPAQVNLNAGKLSVTAENSTLSGIMRDITAKTGMTVEGLSKDQRIFGTYGPSNPREVLYSLLNGMGYNIMMVGDQSNGAPRQLLLSPRSGRPDNGSHGEVQPVQQSNGNGDEDDDTVQEQDTPLPPRPDVNQERQTPPGQVKTPQQMLQELQQLRQRQQQQLQQQQQTNPQ